MPVSGPGILWTTPLGSIICLQTNGCTQVSLSDLSLKCQGNLSRDAAIKVQGSFLSIRNSSFSDCASTGDGSFVQSYHGSLVEVKDSSFVNGFSEGFGGAISGMGSNISIASSRFLNCSSEKGGGAVSTQDYHCYGTNIISNVKD